MSCQIQLVKLLARYFLALLVPTFVQDCFYLKAAPSFCARDEIYDSLITH
jgi:hypothetical protein